MEGAQHGGIGQPSTGFRVGGCPSGLLSCLHSMDSAGFSFLLYILSIYSYFTVTE